MILSKLSNAFERSKTLYKIGDIDFAEYLTDKKHFAEKQSIPKQEQMNYHREILRLQSVACTAETRSARLKKVRDITDDATRRALVKKHIDEIRIAPFQKNRSKLISIAFNDGKKVDLIYDYRETCKRQDEHFVYSFNNNYKQNKIHYSYIERCPKRKNKK